MIAGHADWSVDPRKRWVTLAAVTGSNWRVFSPALVGDVSALLAKLRASAADRPVVLGLDLPIGLPRAFAELHVAEPSFPLFLRALIDRPAFFEVCSEVAQISGARPFYPRHSRAGTTLAPHVAALGFASSAQMSRVCDRKTQDRPAGASLFWTLGANQVGKAALSAWRDLLLPSLLGPQPARLWPFDGRLHDLVALGGLTIAETYPAEAMRQVGVRLKGSKRRQADRMTVCEALLGAMTRLDAVPDATLVDAVMDGFGGKPDGEDRFDSLLGLLCILGVLAGRRDEGVPNDHWIMTWEGWVLGQAPC